MRSSPRVTKHARRVAVLKNAKGFRGRRSKLYRAAKQQVMRSMRSAFIGRKLRKRNFRRLWIARLSAAVRQHGMTYSRFIEGLHKAGVQLNRKQLSELAIQDEPAFVAVLNLAKKHIG